MTKKKKMVLPTEAEVAMHMANNCGIKPDLAVPEAIRFMGYWESKGWCRGKEPMRSWRGSVSSWVANVDARNLTGAEIMDRAAKADWIRRGMKE